MSSTLFTTTDGDVILHAGSDPDPDSKRDFRVHKFILSLASPVFKDMFTLPQPPDQTLNKQRQPSVVDVLDPPEILDTILRLIYPGVEPPKITNLRTLTALLSAADKYDITSIYPVLRGTLKTFLPRASFGVYAVACRFGFSEEMKEAARVGSMRNITDNNFDEEAQHISGIDVFRWVWFVQAREDHGWQTIAGLLSPGNMDWACDHVKDCRDFYFHLEKEVQDAFTDDPCVKAKDLFELLDAVPDPPLGCQPLPNAKSGLNYFFDDETDTDLDEVNKCHLRPMSIRRNLTHIGNELGCLSFRMLNDAFGEGGSV